MKLSMLVVAVGALAMPAILNAQVDTTKKADTASKMTMDTSMKMGTKARPTTRTRAAKARAAEAKGETKAQEAKEESRAKTRTRRAAGGAPMAAEPSEAAAHDTITRSAGAGPQTTGCPLGCPTSKGAAGLTGVQFLALQQELRDRNCGNNRVTGVLDAPTRRAISNCAKKYGVANNAGALLVALNIGFTAADIGTTAPPAKS